MSTKSYILEITPQNYRNAEWLDDNADILYNAISSSLKDPQLIHRAAEDLVLIFPHLLHRDDLKRWGRLVKDLYKAVSGIPNQTVANPDGVQQVYTLVKRQLKIRPTKRRRRERVHVQEISESYLLLLMSHMYHHTEWLTQEFINDLLHFARYLNDAIFYHKIYQTIAFIYNQKRLFDKALDYGRLAYSYWDAQEADDPAIILERGLTAYAISGSYVGLKEYEEALYWQDIASEAFSKIDYKPQYAAISVERGTTYLWMERYEEAAQWLQMALDEVQLLNQDYRRDFNTASILQNLSQAQAYINDLENAEANIKSAISIFEQLNNTQKLVSANHTLAFIEGKLQKKLNHSSH